MRCAYFDWICLTLFSGHQMKWKPKIISRRYQFDCCVWHIWIRFVNCVVRGWSRRMNWLHGCCVVALTTAANRHQRQRLKIKKYIRNKKYCDIRRISMCCLSFNVRNLWFCVQLLILCSWGHVIGHDKPTSVDFSELCKCSVKKNWSDPRLQSWCCLLWLLLLFALSMCVCVCVLQSPVRRTSSLLRGYFW